MGILAQLKNTFFGKKEIEVSKTTLFPDRFRESTNYFKQEQKAKYIPPKYRRFLDMKFDYNSMFILSRYILERTGEFLPNEKNQIIEQLCLMKKLLDQAQNNNEVSEKEYRNFYYFYNDLINNLMIVENFVVRRKAGYRMKISEDMKKKVAR